MSTRTTTNPTPLREARASARLSLVQLAAKAGISVSTLHVAERAPQLATPRTLQRVARVLHVDPETLKP